MLLLLGFFSIMNIKLFRTYHKKHVNKRNIRWSERICIEIITVMFSSKKIQNFLNPIHFYYVVFSSKGDMSKRQENTLII